MAVASCLGRPYEQTNWDSIAPRGMVRPECLGKHMSAAGHKPCATVQESQILSSGTCAATREFGVTSDLQQGDYKLELTNQGA